YWSANGAPAELQDALAKAHFDATKALFMTAAVCIFVGALHGVLSIFASVGRVWPLVTGTVCWVLLFGPSLWAPATYPGSHVITIVLLAVTISLTILAVIALNIAPPPAQRTA